MRSSRVPQALTCGLAVLLVAACTGDPESPEPRPEREPTPVPTAFGGEAPPGIEGEVLRYLHGDTAGVHEILDDPFGVRISSVGDAFLISSGGEDRHLLHDAATGRTLWEGRARFRGFDSDREGGRVLLMTDAEGTPFVLDTSGERVWEPSGEGDVYLDGLAVRRPDGWSAEEPHGAFSLLDAGGGELWSYDFEAPAEPEETDPPEDPSDAPAGDAEEPEEAPDLGVPVAARGDLVLLASGGSALHAHSLGAGSGGGAEEDADGSGGAAAPGEELWTVDGQDEELGLPASAPVPAPRVLGFYPLPGPGAEESEGKGADGDEGREDPEEGEAGEEVLLLRWAQPEAPSTLSAHDPATGDLLWTLEEPGTNPVSGPFDPAGVSGGLYDAATGTLLLPQASGDASVVAVDLAAGEVRWGMEEDEGSISPALAFDGLVYGDSRTSTGEDRQVVLDAVTMDVVEDELSAYVEAVTESGHAILVRDRQRFVYGPPPEEEPSGEPADGASAEPSAEESG
ncbi:MULTISPECIES: PQQ-binding-like beta-propeller repeat protein [unclassified Nocardiopsis]|uniref:outer membrane protein assembly factor BamB family protein n=1 Tax=unclassified Nocardiopsis TaxID=2649073 RepID=UPI00135B0683|nr:MULTISPECIES: PQQ-binding-like beta-propeller repeat protein [unclassified Nocardiopsis]